MNLRFRYFARPGFIIPVWLVSLTLAINLLGCGFIPTHIPSTQPGYVSNDHPMVQLSPTDPIHLSPTKTIQARGTSQNAINSETLDLTTNTIPTQNLQLAGTVTPGEMPTPSPDKPLKYLIYLPPGYDSKSTQRYPVLYLLHGQGFTDDQWIRLGVATTADHLINSGSIAPLIIVMPDETNSLLPDQSSFGQTVATALVPWIDNLYLTKKDRTYRAIGGLSRGASWAVRLGLIYWQTFGVIGAHSYPMFYGDEILIPNWISAIPIDFYPRVYLDIGNKDTGIEYVEVLESALTKYGVPHEYHVFVGYHEEKYWQAHVEGYLLWYTKTWK
jgi:enterochelin esterase-like enzyme